MKLKGLKDLEVVLAPLVVEEVQAHRYLVDIDVSFRYLPAITALRELRLRSLRVTIEADFIGDNDGQGLKRFSSQGGMEKIEEWLRHFELVTHVGELVASGAEPVPSFAVRQDDDAIPIPPWSTDEATAKAWVEKARLDEIERLENQAFRAAQEAAMGDEYGPI